MSQVDASMALAKPVPTWLVSSPHRRPASTNPGDASRPHGLHHARRVGATWTACGLNSFGWPFFWDLAFGDQPAHCCAACVVAVARLRDALRSSTSA